MPTILSDAKTNISYSKGSSRKLLGKRTYTQTSQSTTMIRGWPLIIWGEVWWRFPLDQFLFFDQPPVSIFCYQRASGFIISWRTACSNFFLRTSCFNNFPGDLPNHFFFYNFHHAPPPQMINGRPLTGGLVNITRTSWFNKMFFIHVSTPHCIISEHTQYIYP